MTPKEQVRAILNRHYDYPSQKLTFKPCLDDLTELVKEARRAAWQDVITAACSLFHNSEVNHSTWNTAVIKLVAALEAKTGEE